MASQRAMWLVVVVVVAIMMTENVKLCTGETDQIDQMVDKVKEGANDAKDSWGEWFDKISTSGKFSFSLEDMKQGAENMMQKAKESASDASSYISEKAKGATDSETMSNAQDKAEDMFDAAKHKVGEAYDSTKEGVKSASGEAKEKYEDAKDALSS
ncbi:hypothetical protein vseg_015732 [Gypsophila vaccaria]